MKNERISLDHGSGGRISHKIVSDLMLPVFDNSMLSCLDDGAVLDVGKEKLAFSTDSFTIDPIFFPGGDIGELAVYGTVNDIAMCGASPLFLSAGFIIEEGFHMEDLQRIIESMGRAAVRAGVSIVTGDTKVVQKGAADRIFINTSGIGRIPEGIDISGRNARAGDRIILSGNIADHGIAILTHREGMMFESTIKSDCAPLNHLVSKMLSESGEIHVLRDPTRGGVGTTLNEIAEASKQGILIREDRIPIRDDVRGVCELLGFDPLYLANEGKLLAFVGKDRAENCLALMRQNPLGKDAAIIGEVTEDHPGKVRMKTPIGGTRIVDMLAGEQLPRIC